MLTKELKIGITETVEILKLASSEEIKKIPNKFINFLNDNIDKEYNFIVPRNKKLSEINLKPATKNILAIIYYNYLCNTDEKKENFKKILLNNEKIYNETLKNSFNTNDLFKKTDNKKVSISEQNDNNLINRYMVVHKKNILTKFINFIKKFFIH